MKDLDIRIALAEVQGLKTPNNHQCPCHGSPRTCALHAYHCPDESCECDCDEMPELTLDWLHEVEKAVYMKDCVKWSCYINELLSSVNEDDGKAIVATKHQRAEAILRVLRKWRE